MSGTPFKLRIIEARKLSTGKVDAYCVVKFKKNTMGVLSFKTHETNVIKKSSDPIWNEEFTLVPTKPETDILVISVYDKQRIIPDKFLGKVLLPVAQYLNKGIVEEWKELQPGKSGGKHITGEIHIVCSYGEAKKPQAPAEVPPASVESASAVGHHVAFQEPPPVGDTEHKKIESPPPTHSA